MVENLLRGDAQLLVIPFLPLLLVRRTLQRHHPVRKAQAPLPRPCPSTGRVRWLVEGDGVRGRKLSKRVDLLLL